MKDPILRGLRVSGGLALAACVFAFVTPASAQSTVFRTRRSASSSWNPVLPLTFGVGVDFEHGGDQKELAVPWLVEYNFTQWVRVTAEWGVKFVNSTDPEIGHAKGLEDLETGVDFEFLHERRYTPSLTLVGLIKWPTATDEDVGDPGTDYSVGFTAAKDCVYFELESNLLYTYASDPELPNLMELAIASTYPLNYKWELQLEGAFTFGVSGANRSDGDESEGTFGFSWQITPFQSLESGVLYKDDGAWGVSVGWEYSFGGE